MTKLKQEALRLNSGAFCYQERSTSIHNFSGFPPEFTSIFYWAGMQLIELNIYLS